MAALHQKAWFMSIDTCYLTLFQKKHARNQVNSILLLYLNVHFFPSASFDLFAKMLNNYTKIGKISIKNEDRLSYDDIM